MSFIRTLVSSAAALVVGATTAVAGEVNVYSYRQPFLVEPLFAKFTAETGHTVNVVFAKKGLIERAKQEGRLSPMDVLLTVDIGNLALEYGGGGHANAGTCQVDTPDAHRVQDELIARLTRQSTVAC